MPGVRLTAEGVARLKPRSGRRVETFFDRTKGAPSGFALPRDGDRRARLLPHRSAGSQKKSFLWIGDPGRMSLAEARDRAREADRLGGHGSDPVAERKREERTQRQRPTVAALLSAFVDAGESRKSEKTQDEYRRIVTAEVEGTPVGGTTANDVTAPELDTLCGRIAKRSPTMAINVYKLIRAAFRWGFKKHLVDRDVSAKLDRPAEERRLPTEERTLNDEEVRRLWLGVEALGRETATFIRLPLLCGTRRGETALADWDEFDLRENGTSVWRIRAEHRKGQRGKRRGLVIPLPPLAVQLLIALREETGRGARVFSVVGKRFLANPFRSTEDVRQATGVRFTFMTYARPALRECAE